MHVVIVGNGIIGLSTAFKLLDHNISKISIIGPYARTLGATHAAAAMLNSFAEIDKFTLSNDFGKDYFRISREATKLWPKFVEKVQKNAGKNSIALCTDDEANNVNLFSKGTYIYHNSTSDELEDQNFKAIINALNEEAEPFSFVNPRDIPGYSPNKLTRALEAIFIPDEGWMNPNLILLNLEAALLNDERVEFIYDEVLSLNSSNEQVSSCNLKSGKIIEDFECIMLTSGISASNLTTTIPMSEEIQPVICSFGTSIELKAVGNHLPKNCIRSPNRGGGCGTYLVPYFKGPEIDSNYLVGASAIMLENPGSCGRAVSVAHLINGAINEINMEFYGSEIVKINNGNRPVSFDQFPLIGRVGNTNCIMATGTKRDGLHCAPAIAEFLSNEVFFKNKDDNSFNNFKPNRKLIRSFSRKNSIDAIIEMKINEAFQHHYNPSSHYQLKMFKENLREEANSVHDYFQLDDFGIHPSMYPLYREIANKRLKSRYLNWYFQKS